MKRRFFALLIVLMTSSLAGIICLQGFLIIDVYKGNKENFDFNLKRSMSRAAHKIQDQEFMRYFQAMTRAAKSLKKNQYTLNNISSQEFGDKLFRDNDELHDAIFKAMDSVSHSIQKDTIVKDAKFKKYSARELNAVAEYEYTFYQSLIHEYTRKLKIFKRINKAQIPFFLDKELLDSDIDITYDYAVYINGIITSIKSENFVDTGRKNIYKVNLFENIDGTNGIQLAVNFSGRKVFIAKSIFLMVVLSVILSIVIMLTFVYAYLLLRKQRNVSEIKTDFINNMTHELKTPIASINLALDFIRNPKVVNDSSLREKYLDMIEQESERIHDQVENVLRISKLEKKEIGVAKQKECFHKLVDDAIRNLETQINSASAEVNFNMAAKRHYVLVNAEFIKKVIVNILDNSLKYSQKAPKINIISENVKNSIILRIEDNGVGIDKEAIKNVYDKFFREFTGNIHNVKGQGLGLTYAKQIVEDHQGEIKIKSSKGKGTLVTIKLPVIS